MEKSTKQGYSPVKPWIVIHISHLLYGCHVAAVYVWTLLFEQLWGYHPPGRKTWWSIVKKYREGNMKKNCKCKIEIVLKLLVYDQSKMLLQFYNKKVPMISYANNSNIFVIKLQEAMMYLLQHGSASSV